MIRTTDLVLVESKGYKFYIEKKTAEQWEKIIGPLKCVGMLIDLSSIQFDEQLDFEMQELIEQEKEYNRKHRDSNGFIDTNYLVKMLFDDAILKNNAINDDLGTDEDYSSVINQALNFHNTHGKKRNKKDSR
jgi:hypothetical protein